MSVFIVVHTLMGCAEKKLDISKIEQIDNIQKMSSSELDELIDQLEIFADMTNKDKNYFEKFSEDDQEKIAMFTTYMITEALIISSTDEEDLTDEHCKPFTKKQAMRIYSIAMKILSDHSTVPKGIPEQELIE